MDKTTYNPTEQREKVLEIVGPMIMQIERTLVQARSRELSYAQNPIVDDFDKIIKALRKFDDSFTDWDEKVSRVGE